MEEKETTNLLYNDKEDDRGISTENMNEYIRVGSLGGFILIGALIISIISLLIWGFTGTIPVTITEVGIVSGTDDETNYCICFVDVDANTGIIPEGKSANVRMPDGKTFSGTMDFFTSLPYSAEELRNMFSTENPENTYATVFSDWMMDKVLDGCNYAYLMFISTDENITSYWHQVVQVTVVVDEVRPISFLLR